MSTFYFGAFVFDDEQGTLTGPDGDTSLRPKTAQLLTFLLNHGGELVTKQTLFEHLWPDSIVTEHTLSQSIKDLRRVLGDDAKSPRFIKTLPKRGFQWLVEIEHQEVKGIEKPTVKVTSAGKSRITFLEHLSNKRKPILVIFFLLALLNIVWSVNQHQNVNEQTIMVEEKTNLIKVAILPVINATNDPQMDWVHLGLWDMLLNALARYQSIDVISPGTVQKKIQDQIQKKDLTHAQLSTLNKRLNATVTIQLKLEHDNIGYRLVYLWVDSRSTNKVSEGVYRYDGSLGDISGLIAKLVDDFSITKGKKPNSLPLSNIDVANQDMARGLQAFQTDNIKLARHYFEAALIRDPTFQLAQQHLAKAEFYVGNWSRSESLYSQLLSGTLANHARMGLAQLSIGRGELSQAQTLLLDALQSAKTSNDKQTQIEVLWLLAELRIKQGLWQQQQQLLSEARHLSLDIDDISFQYRALYHLGSLDSPSKDKASRIEELQQALAYFRRWKNVRGEAATLIALGTKADFNHLKRIEYQQLALEKYQLIGDRVGEGWALMSIGWSYLQQFDPHSAENYLNKAEKIHQTMGAITNVALDKFYLGFAALDKGTRRNGKADLVQLVLARTTLHQAIKHFTQIGMPERLPVGHLLLAVIDIEEQQFAEGRKRIPLIAANAMPGQVDQMRAIGQIVSAFVEIRQNNWQLAANILKPLQTKIGNNPLLLHYLARCFYQLGDYQQAVELGQILKTVVANKWQDSDQQRLQLYRNALNNQQRQSLPEVPNLYLLMIAYLF